MTASRLNVLRIEMIALPRSFHVTIGVFLLECRDDIGEVNSHVSGGMAFSQLEFIVNDSTAPTSWKEQSNIILCKHSME